MSFYDNSIEYMLLDLNFKTDWNNILKKSMLQNISEQISENYYPPKEKIFNAFNHFNFKDLNVVILGQDCYHGPGQANGLSFSVNNGLIIPPSLRNILKELNSDLNIKRVDSDFTDLTEQGILFMNCALTVEPGLPGSHLKIWEGYSNYIINYISKNSENIIFVLWGNFAKSKKSLIDTEKHFIIEGTHPSPLSANRGGFFGTKPFSKINNKLKEFGKQEIKWI